MFPGFSSLTFLLAGAAILFMAIGLLFSALGARASIEGFSAGTIGFVMSAYFAGFIVGTKYCPHLIHRLGHIRAFALMASVASAMPILHALFVSPLAWGVLRAITGMCLVGLYIVIESWLNILSPNRYRGQIFAAYVAITLVAMALGQFLLLVGDTGDFIHLALVSILLSLALVPITATQVPQPAPAVVGKIGLSHLYAIAPLGVAGVIAGGLVNSALFSMGTVFAYRVGMSNGGAAAFMSVAILGGALLQWPIGRLSDRYDRKKILIAVAAGGMLLSLIAFVLTFKFPEALLLPVFAYGGLSSAIYGLSAAQVLDRIDASEMVDATQGLLLLSSIGSVIGPLAAGVLMENFIPGTLLLYFAGVLALLVMFGLFQEAASRLRLNTAIQAPACVSVAPNPPLA